MTQIRNQHYAPAVAHSWEKTAAGFIRCRARVLKEGVMNYGREELSELPEGFDAPVVRVLVTRESMGTGESLRSLETAQATTWEHEWVTPDNAATVSKGSAVGTPRIDGPYLEADMVITEPGAIADIESGKLPEISGAYEAGIVFESGEFDGQPYDAKQVNLNWNHIAIIPVGCGRAGTDVRILNKGQEEPKMADEKLVRVRLRNTGKYINVKEEDAPAVEEDQAASAATEAGSGKKLEELMKQVEELNAQIAELTAQAEEGKGELSVYKEKIDELLAAETQEAAAEQMVEERGEADEIIENVTADMPPEKKEEIKNSLVKDGRRLYGEPLKRAVLAASGVKCENMSPAEVNGAFRAQHSMIKNGFGKKALAGAKFVAGLHGQDPAAQRSQVENSKKRMWGKKA